LEFTREREDYVAVAVNGRRWRIWAVRGGWRMEFRDPRDSKPTNAGTFGTLRAAQVEASRRTERDPRRAAR
jgi:hypothetical protein